MVTPKDVRNAAEDADVAKSIYQRANDLSRREGAGNETKAKAAAVATKANELHADLRLLEQHMERSEDIA